MRAAWILDAEAGLKTRVINLHTLKPIDHAAILAAVTQIGLILTVEEHQTGGLGGLVAQVACREKPPASPLRIEMIGIDDRFGQSGAPWELMQRFGLCAEHIARRALDLLGRREAIEGAGRSEA